MSDALLFVLVCLASYRLWRLAALDDLPPLEWLRGRFEGWTDVHHGPEWSAGIACGWCSGSWVAAAVVAAVWSVHPLPLPALWFGAVAAVVGLVAKAAE